MQWKYAGVDLRGLSETLQLPATFSSPGQGLHQLQVLVAIDTAHHTHFLGLLSQTLALYLLVATLVCGLLGWWAANRGLAPLKAMRDKARAISSHSLQERMPIEAVPVEFAELAAGLNAMLDRLEKDFQRLMEFSSDLAHELRTPINNLLTQTQVALTQKRTAEAYRDILASNAEEFERLARMVSDMLFLAKTENGIDLPHREHIRLHEEVRALFEFYEAVADDRDIRLTIHGHANIYGDRLMIRRAVSNLLSNALRYAKAGTGVEVTLDANDHQISLTVTNQGPTIAAADIPRLFDRFYRADPSRGHPGSEGTGLGLAITKAIVEAHRGSIRANSFAERTSFSVALPAATSPTDKAN
jgi:two-component system heavy metal sensor histidine kinase CusS